VNKAFFLDRDGVINVEKHFLYKPSELEFIPGAAEAIKMIKNAGYLTIATTNQSGVARGFFTEDDVQALHNYINAELSGAGTKLDAFYYCPHLPGGAIEKYKLDCNCRKPKIGMYLKAQADFDIDLGESFAIGDRVSDVDGISALVRGSALVKTGHDIEGLENEAAIRRLRERRIVIEENLLSAAVAMLKKINPN
jgi:D-glycero-D-manno-heptose 1,7-bisphosphate phosphatase